MPKGNVLSQVARTSRREGVSHLDENGKDALPFWCGLVPPTITPDSRGKSRHQYYSVGKTRNSPNEEMRRLRSGAVNSPAFPSIFTLLRAIRTYSGSRSIPRDLRPFRVAAAGTLPTPHSGSNTSDPAPVNERINSSHRSSGSGHGCSPARAARRRDGAALPRGRGFGIRTMGNR
jgi:hypothetical protein